METFLGILIPFLGTTLGAACVFFMKRSLSAHRHEKGQSIFSAVLCRRLKIKSVTNFI